MSGMLGFKAEVVLAFQLIARHRAPRLAMLLAATVVLMLLAEDGAAGSLAVRRRTVALIGGALSAVFASRLMAHGGPLSSIRRTAAPAWLVAAGRLTGLLFLTGASLLAASAIAVAGPWGVPEGLRLTAALTVHSAAVGALVMAGTPLVGASAAATLGLLASLVGNVLPSQVGALLATWPPARGAAVLGWNVLPLSWRVERWLSQGGLADPLVLLFWIAVGGLAAGCVATRALPLRPRESGSCACSNVR